MSSTNLSLYQQAIAFRKAFGLPSGYSQECFDLQCDLIDEEADEVFEACQKFEDDPQSIHYSEELLKELADLVFVCYQMAAMLGWDLDEAMNRVFESNMSKLDHFGKPIRREDGKVLKGPSYKPPILTDLVLNSATQDV